MFDSRPTSTLLVCERNGHCAAHLPLPTPYHTHLSVYHVSVPAPVGRMVARRITHDVSVSVSVSVSVMSKLDHGCCTRRKGPY